MTDIETWKNPDKMSERELRKEVKAWRQAMQEGSTVVAEDKLVVTPRQQDDMLHVKIHGKVDGYMPREDSRKLDDILNNNNLIYKEKIAAIKELVHESPKQPQTA